MDRLLLSCVVLLVMLAVVPTASAMSVDRGAVSARACTMTGTAGANRLGGTARSDVICGLGGADKLRGNGAADVLRGGGGADLLQGKTGADRLDGNAGDDQAYGGAGADRLRGGAGEDGLGGGLGPDDLSGGPGRDIVFYGQRGGPVRVTIGKGANDGVRGEHDNVHGDVEGVRGGRGDDVLTGNDAGNELFGGGGRDRLVGRGGSDMLDGGAGDDRIDAREGAGATDSAAQAGPADRVVCGGGEDTALVDPQDIVEGCEHVIGAQPSPVNHAPTGVALSDASVAENAPVGAAVGTLSASDPDPGDTHSFALVPGAGSTDNSRFQIVGSQLRTAEVFDFETTHMYSVRIRATDHGTPAGRIVRAFTITITDVDDQPTAVSDSATAGEDSAASAVDVLANDTDVDGGPKVIASASDPANGTVVLTGGSPGAHTGLTYQPDPDYCNDPPGTAPDTLTYTLNGGSTATVSVTVTCVEDLPTAVNDSATVPEDSAATPIDVLANDTDPDGGPKVIASASDPANGTVILTGGLPSAHTGLTYQPDPNYCDDATPDTFTYTLNGGSTATVAVTVSCGDDPPAAVNDTATVTEDSGASAIDVLANDTDPDGGPKVIAAASDPANGTVVLTGGSPGAHTGLTYEPDPDYCNDPPGTTPDSFTYTLNGGSTATVSVTVMCVDDPPTAVNDSATIAEDSAASAIDVLANDTDPDGGPKTIASASDPANGTVVLTGGSPGAHTGLTYQPDPNYCDTTPDTFTYTLNGGSTATVSVTVMCVADLPTAVDDTATVTEDSAATPIDVLANDTDPDGVGKTIASASDPTNGTVVLTGGLPGAHTGLTYEPDPNYCNDPPGTTPDTFTYTLNGGSTATVSVTVTCVDDPPTAVNDTATVLEDAAATAISVLTNDTDVDGGPKTIGSASDPGNGTVVVTGGGTGLTYQPDPNYCNDPPGTTPDTFTYMLNGGSTATVSVTVTCVNDAPVADDETFNASNSAVGNTTLIGNDASDGPPSLSSPKKTISADILAGDTDAEGQTLVVQPVTDQATTDGGRVTIEADGDFVYTPAAGTSCTDHSDSFSYTVSDQNAAGPGPTPGTDTGTVTIATAACVWYVNNNDPGNSGTSSAPFDTLAQAETASGNGDTVFVFDGDNTSTGYGGDGYAMNAGERLIGEHEGLVVGADTLHPANPGAKPTLTATGADVIDLSTGNEIRGFVIDPSGAGGGIAGAAGDTGATIDDVDITDTATAGTQAGLELNGTTGTFSISNLTVNNQATGVLLNNAGTVNFAPTGTISITSTGAPGLSASGTGLGTSTFDSIAVTGSGTGGVSLTNTTGTTTFGDLALTTTSGPTPAFGVSNGGSVSVPAAGTDNLNATGGPAVDVTGTSGAALSFDAVSSTNSANDGVNLAGLGTGTFSAASGSITGAAGIAFDLDGGSGAVTYPGPIGNGTGESAEITNRTGGTATLSGAITDTSDAGGGINLSSNTGATISFTGDMTLSTGASTAFNATAGGTVSATGTASTLTTTTGAALNVSNTSIGASDLNFRSIASNGAASGVVLNNTGASGGLAVTGNGGTCSSAATCTGGAIQSSSGPGLNLTGVGGGVSLTSMSVNSGGDDGIRGSSVNGLSLATSVVLNNGNAVGERGIDMTELSGSGGLAATTVSGSSESNVVISNDTSNLTAFNVTGSTIANTNMTTGDDGILVLNNGSAAMTVSVTGSTFTDNKGDHFQAASDASSTGSVDVTFDNNALTTTPANDPNVVGGGITLNPGSANDLSFKVRNNNIQQAFDDAINLNLDPSSTAAGSLTGTISGNTIGTAGQSGSGSESSNTITLRAAGAGLARVAIQNNTIREWTNAMGISIATAEGTADIDATVTGNSVKNPDPTLGLNGIRFDAGATAGPPIDDGVICAAVTGNDATGTGVAGAADIRLRQRFNTTIRVPGYGGAIDNDAAVEAFVAANNTGSPVVDATNNVAGGGGGFPGGAACTLPPP